MFACFLPMCCFHFLLYSTMLVRRCDCVVTALVWSRAVLTPCSIDVVLFWRVLFSPVHFRRCAVSTQCYFDAALFSLCCPVVCCFVMLPVEASDARKSARPSMKNIGAVNSTLVQRRKSPRLWRTARLFSLRNRGRRDATHVKVGKENTR